jgi:hypothetical protein
MDVNFSYVSGRTSWKIVKGYLTWLTDQKALVSVINNMTVREKWRHNMRIKKRRFVLWRNVQEMICWNGSACVHILWTHQWRLSVIFYKRYYLFWWGTGYFTLDEKNVSIHYLDYTLRVVPGLTRDFSPTDLVSSPFCRGRSLSNPQNVYFIKFWSSPLSNDKLYINYFSHTCSWLMSVPAAFMSSDLLIKYFQKYVYKTQPLTPPQSLQLQF